MQPSSKRLVRIIVALVILIGLVGLWLLPIRLQIGNNQINTTHTMSTASVSSPDSSLVLQSGIAIQIIAGGHHQIDAALVQQLQQRLSQRLPEVQILPDADRQDAPTGTPILLVEITKDVVMWTPVKSGAQISATVLYASDGDISWRDADSMIMGGEADPIVHARGSLTLTDSTLGLWSQFGYYQRLGVALGDEVFKMIEAPLFDPPGS